VFPRGLQFLNTQVKNALNKEGVVFDQDNQILEEVMNRNLLFLGGIGLGAGLMYIFDPDRGRRRRTTARDAAHHIVNDLNSAVGKTSRDLSNRAQGLVAELNSIFRCEEADDDVVAARVRSKLGRAVSHPHGIQVAANHGRVTLSGRILASEVDQLYRPTG
jgi:osmotically-inducible protein OsmY